MLVCLLKNCTGTHCSYCDAYRNAPENREIIELAKIHKDESIIRRKDFDELLKEYRNGKNK